MNPFSVAVTSRSFSRHPFLRERLLKAYQQVTFNDSNQTLQGAELISFLQHHDMAIVGLERLTAAVLAQLPKLKVISRFGVGLDTLDLAAISRQGIRLTYTAGANKRAVAELVIAFAINLLRHLPEVNSAVKNGFWQMQKGRELSGKTIGIIGFGAIGQDLAHLLTPFNCNILIYDIKHPKSMALTELLPAADIVSVHLPLTAQTYQLLNAERLAWMKKTAILINTSRGGIIDERALKKMLQQQLLAGAAFDVFANEPPEDQELLALANFFATPHIGGSTEEAILAMGLAAIEGLKSIP